MTTAPGHIKWEIRGNIGIITLDNPPQNYLERPDFLEHELLLAWAADPAVNGIIIRGAGRHFSAGADTAQLFKTATDKDFLLQSMEKGNRLLCAIDNLDIPVIAAITGVCFGGGLEIALACHLRICSRSSLFAFPEISHSLIPGLGGSMRLGRICGESTALEILLTGDTFDGEQALKKRIADYAVPQSEVPAFSMNLMERMVEGKSKKVVQYMMRAWQNSRNLSAAEALSAETALFCDLATDELRRRNGNGKS